LLKGPGKRNDAKKEKRRGSLNKMMGNIKRKSLRFSILLDSSASSDTNNETDDESEGKCHNRESTAASCSCAEADPTALPPMLQLCTQKNTISRMQSRAWLEEIDCMEHSDAEIKSTPMMPQTSIERNQREPRRWELRRGPQIVIEESDDDEILHLLKADFVEQSAKFCSNNITVSSPSIQRIL